MREVHLADDKYLPTKWLPQFLSCHSFIFTRIDLHKHFNFFWLPGTVLHLYRWSEINYLWTRSVSSNDFNNLHCWRAESWTDILESTTSCTQQKLNNTHWILLPPTAYHISLLWASPWIDFLSCDRGGLLEFVVLNL